MTPSLPKRGSQLTLSLRVERHSVNSRRFIPSGVVILQVLGSEPRQTRLGGVAQNFPLREGNVGPVEFDFRVETADGDHGGDVSSFERDRLDILVVVVGGELGVHDFSSPEIRDGHLVTGERSVREGRRFSIPKRPSILKKAVYPVLSVHNMVRAPRVYRNASQPECRPRIVGRTHLNTLQIFHQNVSSRHSLRSNGEEESYGSGKSWLFGEGQGGFSKAPRGTGRSIPSGTQLRGRRI